MLLLANTATLSMIALLGRAPAPTIIVLATAIVPATSQAQAVSATSSPAAARPAPAPSSSTAVAPATGTVMVRWGTSWYPGDVIGGLCGGYRLVRFAGYGAEWDFVATAAELRLPGSPTPPLPGAPPSAQFAPGTVFQVGQPLDVEYHNTWYPAHVRQVFADGRVRIRYDGYDASWDETVPRTRLRPRSATSTTSTRGAADAAEVARALPIAPTVPIASGTTVLVRSGGSWYRAQVLAVQCDDLVRIRYEGSGVEWDETVPRSRMRALPAP